MAILYFGWELLHILNLLNTIQGISKLLAIATRVVQVAWGLTRCSRFQLRLSGVKTTQRFNTVYRKIGEARFFFFFCKTITRVQGSWLSSKDETLPFLTNLWRYLVPLHCSPPTLDPNLPSIHRAEGVRFTLTRHMTLRCREQSNILQSDLDHTQNTEREKCGWKILQDNLPP